MNKLFKFSGYIFLGLCGLIILAVITLTLISDEQYKTWTTAAAKSVTGRQLAIDGPFDLKFGAKIGVLAQDISFSNAEWGSRNKMVTADRLYIEISLLPLMKGILDFTVELDGPDILFETNDSGEGNWIFSSSGDTPPDSTNIPAEMEAEDSSIVSFKPYIRNFTIRNLLFTFNTPVADQAIEARLETLRLFVNETEELPLILSAVYQGAPVIIEGTLGNINDWFSNKQTPIILNGKLNAADMKIEGTVGPLFPQPAARLDLSLTAANIATFAPFTGINLRELPGFGPIDMSATLVSPDNVTQLKSLDINLTDPDLSAQVSVTTGHISLQEQNNLKIDNIIITGNAESKELKEIVEKLGIELPVELPSSFSLKTTAAGNLDKLGVNSLEITLKDEGVNVNLSATAENILDQSGITATLTADVVNTANLSKFAGMEISNLGSLTLRSQLSSLGETYKLDALNIQLNGEDIMGEVNATIQDLLVLANVAEKPEEMGAAGIEISLNVDITSISELAAHTVGIEVPDLGGLQISGQANSVEQALQLKSFSAALKNERINANIDATIKDIFALSGINTTVSAKVDSLQTLSLITKSELPETGPWMLNARASSDGLSKSPVLINAKLEGEGTQTVVDATISDIKSPQNLQAKLSVDAESLALLGDIIDKDLPKDEPLKINTNIVVAPGEYSLEKLIILMGKGKIVSDLSYSTPLEGVTGRNRLTGIMSIQDIDITPFFEKSTEAIPPNAEGEVAGLDEVVSEEFDQPDTDEKNKLFSSEPLATGPLQKYDVDLKLDVSDFTISEAFIIDGNATISLDQGLLRLDPFAFKGQGGGTAKGLFELDASDVVVGLEIILDFKDFVFPRVGGTFDLDVDLEGEGESVAALMASLNGHVVANIQDVQMEKTYLSQLGTGLLSQVNPLSSDTTTLECAIARLDFTDGIVNFENKIAAQTTEVTWLGGGEINLQTEELELGLAPTARKAISSMTDLGLASLVHVGGTLAEPDVGLDKKDVAKKFTKYSLHIATGGLSFLAQKAYDNRVSNIDYCKRILADMEKE